jgi:hypothetical protein
MSVRLKILTKQNQSCVIDHRCKMIRSTFRNLSRRIDERRTFIKLKKFLKFGSFHIKIFLESFLSQ